MPLSALTGFPGDALDTALWTDLVDVVGREAEVAASVLTMARGTSHGMRVEDTVEAATSYALAGAQAAVHLLDDPENAAGAFAAYSAAGNAFVSFRFALDELGANTLELDAWDAANTEFLLTTVSASLVSGIWLRWGVEVGGDVVFETSPDGTTYTEVGRGTPPAPTTWTDMVPYLTGGVRGDGTQGLVRFERFNLPPAPFSTRVRETTSSIVVTPFGGGTPVTLSQVLSARCTFGFDQPVSSCEIVLPVLPATINQYATVVVKMGVSGSGNETQVRFSGTVVEFRYDLYPRAVTLVCKGPLWRAAEYENWDDPNGEGGLTIDDLTGTPTATDEAIVQGVLTVAGVPYSGADIDGTGVVWGTDNDDLLIWKTGESEPTALVDFQGPGQSALDYILALDAASAKVWSAGASGGFYRTFDSLTGTVYRTLIGGRPRNALDCTFTEGVDIFQGSATRSTTALRNAVLVTGFDPGQGGAAQHLENGINGLQGDAATPANRHTYTFSSPLIEHDDQAAATAAGYGMDCETVAQALLLEVNREVVTVDLTTPRDDLIGPGQTHLVQGPGGAADRLGVGEVLWVQGVVVELDERGAFSQHLRYVGGGVTDVADGDPNLPEVPL